mgnify:CR=1 FL=1
MKPSHTLLCLLLLSSPERALAEESAAPASGDTALSVARSEPLPIRLEAAFGLQHCINSDTGICTGYPTSFEGQQTGAYGRIGATIPFPDPVGFLSGGLLLDVGGFALSSRRLTSSASVTMHLVGVLRAQIPVDNDAYEASVGIGFGLAHWSGGFGHSWTGATIPVSVSLGYEVLDDLYVGGEVIFFPRIAGGKAPHSLQWGVHSTYRFDIPL